MGSAMFTKPPVLGYGISVVDDRSRAPAKTARADPANFSPEEPGYAPWPVHPGLRQWSLSRLATSRQDRTIGCELSWVGLSL